MPSTRITCSSPPPSEMIPDDVACLGHSGAKLGPNAGPVASRPGARNHTTEVGNEKRKSRPILSPSWTSDQYVCSCYDAGSGSRQTIGTNLEKSSNATVREKYTSTGPGTMRCGMGPRTDRKARCVGVHRCTESRQEGLLTVVIATPGKGPGGTHRDFLTLC